MAPRDSPLPAQHRNAPGDHLSRVATVYRFRSYAPLWNDPANGPLRTTRHNPNILATGDVVYVPELKLREVDRATDQRHRFTAELHSLVTRLAFTTWEGKPVDGVPSEVTLDAKATPAKPAGAAEIEVAVEPTSDRCVVALPIGEVIARVGFLEPADTQAGARQRLTNLGYAAGDSADPKDRIFRSAVEEFQCDHGLQVDGKVGPGTRAALVKRHGC